MMKDIGIIRIAGNIGLSALTAVSRVAKMENKALVVSTQEAPKPIKKVFHEEALIVRASPMISAPGPTWKCKGLHQYRPFNERTVDGAIKVSWICQCGRKL